MPQPKFQSRALLRIRSSLQRNPRPPSPKKLYFRSPHTLANGLGHEFELIMDKRTGACYRAYLVMAGPAPFTGAHMKFIVERRKNQVHICSLHSFASLYELDKGGYCKPPENLRGYGFAHIAIFLASHLAKKEGITRLTIKAASSKISEYYERCGFRSQFSGGEPTGCLYFTLKPGDG